MDITALIDRYFQLAPRADSDAYFAQFVPAATVEDEGHDYRGLDAIRAWRGEVPSASYVVHETATDGGTHVARTEVSGDFPGSPVELFFRFTFADDGRIEALAIRT